MIVVRSDLSMSTGKTCAQVAHASLSSAEEAIDVKKEWYEAWKKEGQRKVVVKVEDMEAIVEIFETAKKAELPCYLVKDAGLTELEPGTITALGIGPAPSNLLDKITGGLELLK